MRLYFPAANGLHPVPEDCQENPRITTVGGGALCGFCGSCLRTGLNLAARLSAGRIRYGLISLETTSSHWSTHKAADFLNFPRCFFFSSSFSSFTWHHAWFMQIIARHPFIVLLLSDPETTRKEGRAVRLIWGWNSTLKLSLNARSVNLVWIYGEFAPLILWVSYGRDLLATWYSNLAEAQVPLIVSDMTHTSTQYLSKHVASTHSFLLLSLSLSSYQPHHHPLLPHHPFSCRWSWIWSTTIKLTVTDRNFCCFFFFFFYQWDPTGRCLWT